MPATPQNLPAHEIIGCTVTIVDSTDPSFRGLFGRVIDETKNTLAIETDGGRVVTVAKSIATFAFDLAGTHTQEKAVLDGAVIVGRPEERLKKFRLTNTKKTSEKRNCK